MKKLYIIHHNPRKHFFNEGTFDNVELNFASAEDFLMDYGNGKTKPFLYYKNEKVEVEKCYLHFVSKGPNTAATSCLIHFLRLIGASYSNAGYENHSNMLSKHVTLFDLACARIAIPRTFTLSGNNIQNHFETLEDRLGYPLVLKGRGSEGQSVFLCKNRQELVLSINEMKEDEDRAKLVSVQEPLSGEYDVRVIMSFGNPVASMKRQSEDFKNNYALGGKVYEYILSEEEKIMINKVDEVAPLDVYGIDFMYDKENAFILEIQHGPGLEGIRIANPKVEFEKQFVVDLLEQVKR